MSVITHWYASEGDGVPWVVIQDDGGMHHCIADCDEQVHAEKIARALNNLGAVEERDDLKAALEVLAKPEWSKPGDEASMRRYAQKVLDNLARGQ